jgi:hypothetical protein
MLMNRTFLLGCATVVTLGIAAASSAPAYARPCRDLDSDRDKTICYVRSAIYQAEAAASEAKARHEKEKRARASSTTRPRDGKSPEPAKSTTPGDAKAACGLTKEYVDGALIFRDTCTGESAQRD